MCSERAWTIFRFFCLQFLAHNKKNCHFFVHVLEDSKRKKCTSFFREKSLSFFLRIVWNVCNTHIQQIWDKRKLFIKICHLNLISNYFKLSVTILIWSWLIYNYFDLWLTTSWILFQLFKNNFAYFKLIFIFFNDMDIFLYLDMILF